MNKIYLKITFRILIQAALLLVTGNAFSQEEKVDIDILTGANIPELYHCGIGLCYMPNVRLDFNFGSDFKNDANGTLYELNINHATYFGDIDPKVNRKLSSINTGFSFFVEQSQVEKSTAAYLNLFFAQELPISRRIFIQPEMGLSYFLFEHIIDNAENISSKTRIRIIPKLGMSLILKI